MIKLTSYIARKEKGWRTAFFFMFNKEILGSGNIINTIALL